MLQPIRVEVCFVRSVLVSRISVCSHDYGLNNLSMPHRVKYGIVRNWLDAPAVVLGLESDLVSVVIRDSCYIMPYLCSLTHGSPPPPSSHTHAMTFFLLCSMLVSGRCPNRNDDRRFHWVYSDGRGDQLGQFGRTVDRFRREGNRSVSYSSLYTVVYFCRKLCQHPAWWVLFIPINCVSPYMVAWYLKIARFCSSVCFWNTQTFSEQWVIYRFCFVKDHVQRCGSPPVLVTDSSVHSSGV